MNDKNRYVEKTTLSGITLNDNLTNILRKHVSITSQIITEAMFLLNQYTLFCLEYNFDVNLDCTLIRQCVSLVINNGDVELNRVKEKYKAETKNADKIKTRTERVGRLYYIYNTIYKANECLNFGKVQFMTSSTEYYADRNIYIYISILHIIRIW